MAYEAKTNWKLDDTVMPEDLNRIERGIFNAEELATVGSIKVLEASTENVIDFNTLIEPGIYLIRGLGTDTLNGYNATSNTLNQLLFITTQASDNGTLVYQALLIGHTTNFYRRMRNAENTWTTWVSHSYTSYVTIPTTGWTTSAPYYVDITLNGATTSDSVIVTPRYTGTLSTDQTRKENWNKIDRIVTNTNYLRVYAFEEIPTATIPVQIQGIR